MNIGLVANDAKKELMINFCIAYRNILAKHKLYATGTTGRMITDAVGLQITLFLPGPLGGGSQLCAQIECGQLDALIYLIDPAHPDLKKWDYLHALELCDIHNIPLATNLASAEILIFAINNGGTAWLNN